MGEMTDEQRKLFEQLRRAHDREYARQRRDKQRQRKYSPRTTRIENIEKKRKKKPL